jgi:uncharacterized protein YhdP
MINEMPFSHPADPRDVHGTSWVLNQAGQGRSDRRNRAAIVRAHQIQPLRPVASPLQPDVAQQFADEWRRDNAPMRHVGRDALVGGVLGFALVKAAQNRRGRR